MRTTIDIPDTLFDEIKLRVVRERITLKDFLVRAAEQELKRSPKRRTRISLPLIDSKRPGTLRSLTNAEIDDLLN